MSIIPREKLLDYPDLYVVDEQPGSFMCGLKSLVAFEPGLPMTYLTGLSKCTERTWSSVQSGVGEKDNIELNSVLVFINHSCDPNVAVDLSSSNHSEWHFRALKKINPGDDLSFFYPSTEWDMVQGFDCRCGSQICLGKIRGSKHLSRKRVEESGYMSPWVSQLMQKRDASTTGEDLRVAA